MDEKEVKKQETRRNALTIGIVSQATADRFLKIKTGTYEETVKLLLDAYERPNTDNSDTIYNLQRSIEKLEARNGELRLAIEERDNTIEDLRGKLNDALVLANGNAEKALAIQVATDGAIILRPHPVVAYFLNEMAAKTNSTPERILEELFLADLQNPTVNNLPYTVTSREIRKVSNELKGEETEKTGKES